MLFEVTIVIKFVLFDVIPSKNKGVTSNTQKITTRLVQEGVAAPCQTPARQKTAHLWQSVVTCLPGGDLPLQREHHWVCLLATKQHGQDAAPWCWNLWPHEAPLEPVTVEPVNSRGTGNIGLKKRITKRFLPSWLWSSHPIILFPSLS